MGRRAELTPRERLLVEHYALHGDPYTAYVEAGYTALKSKSHTLGNFRRIIERPLVAEFLESERERIGRAANACIDVRMMRVLREMASLAFSDIGLYLGPDNDVLPVNELPDVARAAVKKLKRKVTRRATSDGGEIEEVTTELELHNKWEALKHLGDLVGLKAGINPETGETSDGLRVVVTLPSGRELQRSTGG